MHLSQDVTNWRLCICLQEAVDWNIDGLQSVRKKDNQRSAGKPLRASNEIPIAKTEILKIALRTDHW